MDKVAPFPNLRKEEEKPTHNGKCQPFDHAFFIHPMTGFHGQYHGNGANDKNKGHQSHIVKRRFHLDTGESLENLLPLRPISGMFVADKPIGDQ